MRTSRIVALALLLVPSPATASLIYIGDGAIHDISTPTGEAYQVGNGTLNLLPGADVLDVSGFGDSVLITMSGGQVKYGIDVTHGNVNISGGQSGSASGSDGLTVFNGTANITGGTFVGGNNTVQPGNGVTGSAGTYMGVPAWSTLNISGGTFQGGSGSGGFYGGTTGYSLLSLGNTTVTGGHFQSPIAINTAYGGITDFLGTNLSYHDHILSGILQNGDAINVRVYPDIADAGANVNDSATRVRFGTGPTGPPVVLPPAIPEPAPVLIFSALAAIGLVHRRQWANRPSGKARSSTTS